MIATEKMDPTALIPIARAAMIQLYRRRVATAVFEQGLPLFSASLASAPSVSAIDLAEYLDTVGWGADRRWSGVVFTAPRGLWSRVGYAPNPRRHASPTPLFRVNEARASELGL